MTATAIPSYYLASTSSKAIQELAKGLKIDLTGVLHITATSTLESAQGAAGYNSISIAKLIDLVVLSGPVTYSPLDYQSFPRRRSDSDDYHDKVSSWNNQVRNIKMSQPVMDGVKFREVASNIDLSARTRAVFLRSSRTILKAISWASSAGFRPEDFTPSDEFDIALKRVWESADAHIFSSKVRNFFWDEKSEAANSLGQIVEYLADSGAPLVNVFLHGFHYYTPVQWRLFNILNNLPNVNLHCIVHDDGESETHAIWRSFYTTRFGFKKIGSVKSVDAKVSPSLEFLNDVLGSKRPDFVPTGVEIVECNSPAEFARDFDQQYRDNYARNEAITFIYAADEKSVAQYLHRIDMQSEVGESNLLQMPVGAFLVALHNCLRRDTNGQVHISISSVDMLTMLTSGFVPAMAADSHGEVVARKIPEVIKFFHDCVDITDWTLRAENLERLLLSEQSDCPDGIDNLSVVDRNAAVANNPLLLLPWANLSHHEVFMVREAIQEVISLTQRILENATSEGTTIHKHISNLMSELVYGLQNLSESERAAIESKLNAAGFDNVMAVDGDALIEIVDFVLQRKTDFGLDELDEPEGVEDSRKVMPLRALDVFGFDKRPRPIAIANLSDQAFPQQPAGWPWPLAPEKFSNIDSTSERAISAEIIATRARTASLSDTYLLGLALGATDSDNRARLSWISDVAGSRQELSPLVRLISKPDGKVPDGLAGALGGIPIGQSLSASELEATTTLIKDDQGEVNLTDFDDELRGFGPIPSSSAHVCQRRFALQWVFGSPQFVADHMQENLHGNLYGWLQIAGKQLATNALRIVEDYWRHLSPILRSGSRAMNFIRLGGARPELVFYGRGQVAGIKPIDIAYQHAIGRSRPIAGIRDDLRFRFLPEATPDADACQVCPINKNCSVRAIK